MNRCVLIISHTNYRIVSAGVERYIKDKTKLLNDNNIQTVQIFHYHNFKGLMPTFGINVNGTFEGLFDERNIYYAIMSVSRKYDLEFVAVHLDHFIGWNKKYLEKFIFDSNLPVILFIHDYFSVCEYITLDEKNKTCLMELHSPSALCKHCSYYRAGYEAHIKDKHFLHTIEKNIIRVVAPSDFIKQNWGKVYPKLADRIVVREHLSVSQKNTMKSRIISSKEKINIAFIGNAVPFKGINVWNQLVESLSNENFRFFYLGASNYKKGNVKNVYVDFNDDKSYSMQDALLSNKIDIVLLWSLVPESYSYTFFECLEANLFVITNNYSGNIKCCVQKYNNGAIFKSVSQCISYLKDYKRVIHNLEDNSAVRYSVKENTEITSLIEIENYNDEKNYIASKKTYKNQILSMLYKMKYNY